VDGDDRLQLFVENRQPFAGDQSVGGGLLDQPGDVASPGTAIRCSAAQARAVAASCSTFRRWDVRRRWRTTAFSLAALSSPGVT